MPARVAGGLLWGLLLTAAMAAAAALDRTGANALALLTVAITAGLAVVGPDRWRRLTRRDVVGRAAAEGASALNRWIAPGVAVALSALAVACMVDAMNGRGGEEAAATTATYLVGALALLVAMIGAAVVFPGAWLMPERPWSGGRRLWVPTLLLSLAVVYPGAYGLYVGASAAVVASPSLLADVVLIVALGGASALGMWAARALLPRPFVAVDIDPRGERAVAARAGGAWLVELESGARVASFIEGRRCARFSPDGTLVALDGAGGEVVVRRSTDGALVRRLYGAPRDVQALAFAPDNSTLAAAGEPAWAALWALGSEDDAAVRRPTQAPYARSLAFSPDGRELVVVGGSGGGARVPLTAGGAPQVIQRASAEGQVARATLSPTGRAVACAAGAAPAWNRVMVTRLSAGHQTPAWAHDLGETVRVVAYGAGGHVAVASLLSDVRLYDDAGALVASQEQLGGTVAALAVDASGRRVLVGGRWALRCWEPATGTVVRLAARGAAPGSSAALHHARAL
ncbi:MAG: hypothetical protein CVU56_21540 [Deltaproteobacteria bacterium HGW-Deltaproteobacteria-14]|jgi:hypothetical protein|nr:MAG: hypothetical protein CVU56_21540 [Deltaproteobacteria bacterium HGW-Deltaproteobacteria-14]